MSSPGGANRADVWDQLLDQDWQEKRKTADWKGLPYVHHHIALLVGGRHGQPPYWYDHLRDAHVRPYVANSEGPRSMIPTAVNTVTPPRLRPGPRALGAEGRPGPRARGGRRAECSRPEHVRVSENPEPFFGLLSNRR